MAEWYELSTSCLMRLASFLFWSNLYFYVVEHVPDKSPEWCSRVVTLLHGTIAAVVGWGQCQILKYPACIHSSQLTGQVLPSHYALMLWSWGYFAFDLLWCALYWTDALLMLCHHMAALSAITISMQQDNTGCSFACTLALMEITNPLLQIRWFLKKEGYDKTYIYLIIEVLFLASFIFLRGVIGTYIIYWTLRTNYFSRDLKILAFCLYAVSIALLYDVVGFIQYKYMRELGTGYRHFTPLGHSSCLTFQERQPLPSSLRQLISKSCISTGINTNA